jgi:hypothetical protein
MGYGTDAPDAIGFSLGGPIGPAEGFKDAETAESWLATQKHPIPMAAGTVDPTTKHVTLHALMRDGEPLVRKSTIESGGSRSRIANVVDSFRDTNADDARVDLLFLSGYDGPIEPGAPHVAKDVTAPQLFKLD